MIFHLAVRDDWDAALATGVYPWSTRGLGFDQVGYVHCSFENQWRGVHERFYADLADDRLVLLVIDEARLESPPVIERLDGAPEAFPHLYSPLPVDAVVEVRELRDRV